MIEEAQVQIKKRRGVGSITFEGKESAKKRENEKRLKEG